MARIRGSALQRKVVADLKAAGFRLRHCQLTYQDCVALRPLLDELVTPGVNVSVPAALIEAILKSARHVHIVSERRGGKRRYKVKQHGAVVLDTLNLNSARRIRERVREELVLSLAI